MVDLLYLNWCTGVPVLPFIYHHNFSHPGSHFFPQTDQNPWESWWFLLVCKHLYPEVSILAKAWKQHGKSLDYGWGVLVSSSCSGRSLTLSNTVELWLVPAKTVSPCQKKKKLQSFSESLLEPDFKICCLQNFWEGQNILEQLYNNLSKVAKYNIIFWNSLHLFRCSKFQKLPILKTTNLPKKNLFHIFNNLAIFFFKFTYRSDCSHACYTAQKSIYGEEAVKNILQRTCHVVCEF